jgi:hypothetical protein
VCVWCVCADVCAFASGFLCVHAGMPAGSTHASNVYVRDSMYECMHVCMHYVCVCYGCVYACMHVCMCVSKYACMHVCK